MTDPTNEPGIEDELLNLLGEAGALPTAPDITDAERAAADVRGRAALIAITARPHPSIRGGSRRRTIAVRTCATALVAAAASVAVVVTRSGDHRTSPPIAASTPQMLTFSLASRSKPLSGQNPEGALNALASRAARAPTAGSGDYQLIETESWQLTSASAASNGVFVPNISKRHVQPDGTSMVVRWAGQPLDKDGQLLTPIGDTATGTHPIETVESPSEPDPAHLNPSSKTLLEDLGNPAGCGSAANCAATSIASLHAHAVVPPTLEAALWRNLARTSGIEYLGTTVDRLGRSAEAFSATASDNGERTLLLISPDTGWLLETETIQPTPGGSPYVVGPAVTNFTAYVVASRSPRLVRPMG